MTNQDAYVEGIAHIYEVNILPYMEAWGLKISDEAKAKVYENNYPLMNILKDMVNQDTLQAIMSGEAMDRKYALISNEILQKYTTQGNMTLTVNIDDITQIQGKVIQIKDGKNVINTIKIEDSQIETQLPVGTYFLQMPVMNGYSYQYAYIQIKEDMDCTHIYTYEKLEDTDYDNYLMFRVLGYNYDTIAYQLTFKENYTKAEIRYPNQSAMSGNEHVKIYDNEGEIVTEDVATGGYFDFNKGTHEITLEPGYKIEVCYPNKFASKVVAYNILTNAIIPEYKAIDTVTRYTVIENGIMREDMSEENADDVAYAQLKVHLTHIIETYKQKVTEEELQNKRINYEEKTEIIRAYNQLKEEDKVPYTAFINRIKQGGVPTIVVIAESLEYDKGTPIDVYTLIKAVDNEDGVITIDKNSTVVRTNLKNDEAGTYFVTYEVSDADKNIATKTIEITIIGDTEIPEEGEDGEEIPPPPIEPDEGEEENPIPPNEEEGEEMIPPESDEEDKEEEEKPVPPTEDDVIPPPVEPDEEEEEKPIPPNREEGEEIIPPPMEPNQELEEVILPESGEENTEEDKNTGNNENMSEIEFLSDMEDMDIPSALVEEESVLTIQGDYEDEFGENIEDNDVISEELLHEKRENTIIKVFITSIILASVTIVLIRKKLKNR